MFKPGADRQTKERFSCFQREIPQPPTADCDLLLLRRQQSHAWCIIGGGLKSTHKMCSFKSRTDSILGKGREEVFGFVTGTSIISLESGVQVRSRLRGSSCLLLPSAISVCRWVRQCLCTEFVTFIVYSAWMKSAYRNFGDY